MSVNQSGPFCGKCDRDRWNDKNATASPHAPCPDCNYTGLSYRVQVSSTVVSRASMSFKKRKSGKGKPTLEGKVGSSLNRDTGEWLGLEQVVDRENNRYKKKLINPKTGKVLRDDDGRLTDHQGFGNAKYKKANPNG